jgi:hypothetical protein
MSGSCPISSNIPMHALQNNDVYPTGHSSSVQRRSAESGDNPKCALIGIQLIAPADVCLQRQIGDIIQMLTDDRYPLDEYRHSMPGLQLLPEALTLTTDVIRRYENTTLAQGVTDAVSPVVKQAHSVLQRLLDTMDHSRRSLMPTIICDLWCRVCWGLWEANEIASFSEDLSACLLSLNTFLKALDSYVFIRSSRLQIHGI